MVITVGLIGNPNVGKTSIFNRLVGARQYVANWPGVTVSKIEGATTWKNDTLHVIDLPGTYSLTSQSTDEKITRDFLFFSPPNVTVVIADSINPEQSFYLLIEALELNSNAILAMNSIDEAKKLGIKINKFELQKHFGIPVVFTSAKTGEGIDELKDLIVEVAKGKHSKKVIFNYEEFENIILEIEKQIPNNMYSNKRFAAIKFLENDKDIREKLLPIIKIEKDILEKAQSSIPSIRYSHVENIIKEAYSGKSLNIQRNINEKIDHIFTHKYLGIPILLLIMYLVFKFTFDTVQPLADLLDIAFSNLSTFIKSFGENTFTSLIADGVIGGVGGILVFIPNIFALFFALGILEESGYLPRAAFVVDRVMYKMKLSGRSFMSLLLGFGCNVPSIMSTRGLPDEKERLGTILASPFISCSARLPVYILITSIFFNKYKSEVLFSIYIISILITAITAYLVNRLFFKGEDVPLVMELPRYRIPTFRNIVIYMWNKGSHFIKKAGTIIFAASIVVWFLSYFPSKGQIETSYAAYLGKFIEPILKPLGFNWQIGTALFFGGVAKEVIVSTLSMLYGFAEQDIITAKTVLSNSLSSVSAYALLIFILLYIPCFATLASIKSETGRWKWVMFSVFYSLTIAYVFSLLVVTVGNLIF
ncbi:ferrous iron transport protein B [Thermosipho atlanticus]|uniref:Ferrous iron transport protein B n=1 Tax=Thermosipho atlanticus DSM 15807 TaxID=1123380 RepID=A0A1M5STI4_9BACT|nr:ferrous iron transport protein B [Thermosipho atlanticus]SHH41548.1 ferrous iron transport protein B [Thermosipho atlanticus DSM 15807]